jgi:hypothetical protein
MIAPRVKELLIGMKLPHLVASLDRALEQHPFTTEQQQRIVAQLFEIETEAAGPSHGHTVH